MPQDKIEAMLALRRQGRPLVGRDRIDLLEAVATHGSITKAAKATGFSYKTAWEAVDAINNLLPTPAFLTRAGGRVGGGRGLVGRRLGRRFRRRRLGRRRVLGLEAQAVAHLRVGEGGGQAPGVAAALQFHAGERGAFFLGLDHAAGLAVHVQQVVGKAEAGVEREFADGDAGGGVDVGVRDIADVPARLLQQRVDADSGFLLWRHGLPLQRILVNKQ